MSPPQIPSVLAASALPDGFSFSPIDPATLVKIDTQALTDPWTLAQFTSSLDSGGVACGVREGERWCGFSLVLLAGDVMELLKLSILPVYQRRGLATALLEHMMDVARDHGIEACMLEVRKSNVGAQLLYEKNGFVCVGTRRDYYPLYGASEHKREDARVYRRELC